MDYASQRAEQLRKHIQDSLQLLKEYEDKLRLADDPKEKERCRHEIVKLKESVERWKVELTSLEAAPGAMPSPRPKAPPPPPTALGRWASFSDPVKVAIIGLVGAILVAIIGLFIPIVQECAKYIFSRPVATLTAMPSLTVTPTWVGEVTATPTATSTPTHTATPTPSEEVVIEIDGVVIDAGDDRFQEVDCGSSPRIEVVKVLDSTGDQIQLAVLSYNWSFNPSDPHNEDKPDSKNYVINYYVPCELDNQTVTIEVLKDGETLGVRSIRFNIEK